MSEQQRDDTGRFSERVTEQDALEAFAEADEPVLTVPALADSLGMSRQAVTHRLERMHEAGHVDRTKAGTNAVVWWATDNGESAFARQLSRKAIADQYGDDYFGQNPG
jgi:DNA-binding MarR family transcriptional regulator